jgi:hypothetical protein
MAKKVKKISKLDAILDALEDWCVNFPTEERLPGKLSTVRAAKKELLKLRKNNG